MYNQNIVKHLRLKGNFIRLKKNIEPFFSARLIQIILKYLRILNFILLSTETAQH